MDLCKLLADVPLPPFQVVLVLEVGRMLFLVKHDKNNTPFT